MNRTLSSRLRMALGAAALVGAATAGKTAHAQTAQFEWVPLSVPGCASAIAVGPNNVPWILGCGTAAQGGASPSGPQGIFYLQNLSCGSETCLGPPPQQWTSIGQSGVALAVNLNGLPFATDTSGVIHSFAWSPTAGNDSYPNSSWEWLAFGRGAVSAIAIGMNVINPPYSTVNQNFELFWPSTPAEGYVGGYVDHEAYYGIGCGSNCGSPLYSDHSIWTQTLSENPGIYAPGWGEMSGGAIALSIFTDPTTGAQLQNQTLWALNAEDQIYVQNGSGWAESFLPGSVGVKSLTDHFALGTNGTVYYWQGNSDGMASVNPPPSSGPGSATWGPFATAENATTGFVWLKQIAWAQQMGDTPSGLIDNSLLWGIDYSGNVYSLQLITPPGIPPK